MMRLCSRCQSKMPDDVKGLCATCKAERKPSSDAIKCMYVHVSRNATQCVCAAV
jgi:hypothetical protein